MRYLVQTIDGVIPLCTYPTGVRELKSGREFAIHGIRRRELAPGVGLTVLYGEVDLVVGNLEYQVEDLQPDTLPGYLIRFPDPTKDVIAKWTAAKRAKVVSCRMMDKAELPSSRWFRAAWRYGESGIAIDMAHARTLQRDYMRIVRGRLLEALDVEYLQALEQSDAIAEVDVATRKQELRDVTVVPDIDSAATPEQLEAVWPECLGTKPRTQSLL